MPRRTIFTVFSGCNCTYKYSGRVNYLASSQNPIAIHHTHKIILTDHLKSPFFGTSDHFLEMFARCGSEAHSGARLCGQNPLAAKLDPMLF